MESFDVKKLILQAMGARTKSYSPYSRYRVGAALISKQGRVYPGCNVENSSYGGTVCAERVAFFRAVQEGEREFEAIAIVGGPSDGKIEEYAYPCGICRQVMSEFCGPDFKIIVAKSLEDYKIYSLNDMLPHAFGNEQLWQ